MEKMKMQSMDITESNIDMIKQLFPSCVTEFKDPEGNIRHGIDFEKLKEELSPDLIDSGERERERERES